MIHAQRVHSELNILPIAHNFSNTTPLLTSWYDLMMSLRLPVYPEATCHFAGPCDLQALYIFDDPSLPQFSINSNIWIVVHETLNAENFHEALSCKVCQFQTCFNNSKTHFVEPYLTFCPMSIQRKQYRKEIIRRHSKRSEAYLHTISLVRAPCFNGQNGHCYQEVNDNQLHSAQRSQAEKSRQLG